MKTRPLVLYLKEILERYTDAEHGIRMSRILEFLSMRGLDVNRRTVYLALDTLQYDLGMDIIRPHGSDKEYKLLSRDFDVEEVMCIIDALGTSKFLSGAETQQITRKLYGLVSKWDEKVIREHVAGMASKPESTTQGLKNIGYIRYALEHNQTVSFQYSEQKPEERIEKADEWTSHNVKPLSMRYEENTYVLEADGGEAFYVDRMKHTTVPSGG